MRIEATVGVGHIGPGDAEYLRMSGERSGRDFGQLTVITRRKIGGGLPHLFFDEIIVVDQPFGRRRDRRTRRRGRG